MKHGTIRIAAVILAMLMLFGTAAAAAYAPKYDSEANVLKELGLFIGTGSGFELEREPNRAEALVMLVRLLGKEAEAKECTAETPLKDVEGRWMEGYVAWAYTNNITNGVSADEFGYEQKASAKMFVTFVLRALGYSDAEGDFTYSASLDKAAELGLITDGQYASPDFYRDDCVNLSYTALTMKLKGSEQRLIDKLVAENAVAEQAAVKCGFIDGYVEPADGTTVYFSIAVDGELQVAGAPVTVSEPTVEAVIRAAHAKYFDGGEAGFAAGTDPMYGIYMINTCWGIASNPYVILNSAPLAAGENALSLTADTAAVMNGDNVVIIINTDFMNPKPVVSLAVSTDGEEASVTAIEWTLDIMTFTFKNAPFADCVLLDADGNLLGKTDADGKATVKAQGVVCADGYSAAYIDKDAEREPAEVVIGIVVETMQPVSGTADYVLACVGDSLTFGMGSDNPDTQSYPSLLTGKDGSYKFATENYGHSGATVDYTGFSPYANTDEYRASLKTEADIVLLMLGTNDTILSFDLSTFPDNYKRLIDTYASLPCQPRIIVMLPPHFFDTNTGDAADINLVTVIDHEKAIAQELGLSVIDVYSFTENKPEWSADGVHFTVDGYEKLADFVYTELCKILDSDK